MPRRGFNPARRTGTTVPRVQALRYATGQTFKDGALVVLNAAGEIVECGADPVAVQGVALAGAGTGAGFGVPNSDLVNVTTGRLQEVPVAIADREQEFSARAVNGATDPVLPLQTHIGEQYGVAKVGDDWVIDFAEVTTKVVHITDIMPETNRFLCKFLEVRLGNP